ncbi:hypothetical protein STRTUCAR8_00601 [Streptomyces turgidiscabies Car8]|uniref:Uncharacterized protein n=1 Tax=Streptomyces turgidiscabies (strain Car8) TaxID=698760 RepID=L7FE18_STRT8|nr:hypothetical protein STRTUCAR8_00601 [Streptomyces turgidiscabies Car8]
MGMDEVTLQCPRSGRVGSGERRRFLCGHTSRVRLSPTPGT